MSARRADIACAGNACADLFVHGIDIWPGESTREEAEGGFDLSPGGNALNVAVGLSKYRKRAGSGPATHLVACIAADRLGDIVLEHLRGAGVRFDERRFRLPAGKPPRVTRTDLSLVRTAKNAEPSFVYIRGAGAKLDATMVEAWIDEGHLASCAFLHLCGLGLMPGLENDEFAKLIEKTKAEYPHLRVSLDVNLLSKASAASWGRRLARLLPHVDYFVPNLLEICQVTSFILVPDEKPWRAVTETDFLDESVMRQFMDALRGAGVGGKGPRNLIVKNGSWGCCVLDEFDIVTKVPGYTPRKLVDATGAGDAWCAGFLRALADGEPVVRAAREGNRAGRRCVESLGATAWELP